MDKITNADYLQSYIQGAKDATASLTAKHAADMEAVNKEDEKKAEDEEEEEKAEESKDEAPKKKGTNRTKAEVKDSELVTQLTPNARFTKGSK